MGFFKSRKRDVVDLTPRYRRQQEKMQEEQSVNAEPSSETGAFSFLGNLASTNSSSSEVEQEGYVDVSEPEERKKKLAKRLMDITDKLEDLSNQIYRLQQRIEVVEKKSGVGDY